MTHLIPLLLALTPAETPLPVVVPNPVVVADPVHVIPPGTPPQVVWVMHAQPFRPVPQVMPCPPGSLR